MTKIKKETEMDDVTQDEVNMYLDMLRESGATNMYGAAVYIQAQFNIDRKTANKMLFEWMRTFADRRAQA